MTEKKWKAIRALLLFLALLLMPRACPALADDAEMKQLLPGSWTCSEEAEGSEEAEAVPVQAVLELAEDGGMTLRFDSEDARYAFTRTGTWAFELVSGGMDRVTLRFRQADGAEAVLVYNAYTESWTENDIRSTWLILEQDSADGASPFEEVYGFSNVALSREEGPNMRVVNCSSYVSLRAKRSTSSARRAKVPLGALVHAYPEYGTENGFLYCEYQGQSGYILAEYLAPAK